MDVKIFFLLFPLWMAFCWFVWQQRQRRKDEKLAEIETSATLKAELDSPKTAVVFQKRRIAFVQWGTLPVIGAGTLFVVQQFNPFNLELPSYLGTGSFILLVLSLLNATWLCYSIYKCPVCEQVPVTTGGGGERGIALDPDICSSCGARLK